MQYSCTIYIALLESLVFKKYYKCLHSIQMIALRHINMKDRITFEKINLNPFRYVFNYAKNIDLNLLRINKKCTKYTDVIIHEIKYIRTQNTDNQNIDNEVPLCLSFSDADVYIIEENGNKYLIFALTKNNRKVLEIYKIIWSKIKKQSKCNSAEAINSNECNSIESIEYEKYPIKIRLDSYNDDLPLDKILCFSILDIIVESVFQIKHKYHPQTHIHECEYEC